MTRAMLSHLVKPSAEWSLALAPGHFVFWPRPAVRADLEMTFPAHWPGQRGAGGVRLVDQLTTPASQFTVRGLNGRLPRPWYPILRQALWPCLIELAGDTAALVTRFESELLATGSERRLRAISLGLEQAHLSFFGSRSPEFADAEFTILWRPGQREQFYPPRWDLAPSAEMATIAALVSGTVQPSLARLIEHFGQLPRAVVMSQPD